MQPIRSFATAILFLLLSYIGLAQQLKLGKNPYTVEKSAILELQSDNQGLLLTRITDTTSINFMSPPDGMIIYFTPAKRVLIRANGYWQSLPTIIDTSSIANFYLKARSLFSGTAPITYNNATGQIGITQASTSTNGYISSSDWNTFNNKAGSFTTGNLTETGSGILTISGGTNAIIGSGTSIQVKQANTSQNGFLSSTDWNTFNNKLSTIDTSNISNFYLKVRKNLSAGTGIGYSITSGVISNAGVLSVNGNTGVLTMDTSYISNFYLKTRSLFSNTAPITYNNATGAVGITQASTSTNGYLSSADWNTFNNKASAFTTGNLTETGSGILTITGGTGAVAGSGTAIQVKQASTSQNGFLSSTDWNTFNSKLSTIDTTNISNFYLKVRKNLSAGTGIGYSNTSGVISNTGVLSLNGNTGALTMDTGYISNFSVKTRGLFSGTAPVTFNNATGAIGITQATASTNGYLSSADWNTFNNKAGAFTTGNLTETGSGILTITGGTGAVAGSGTSIQVKTANTLQDGFLSSADWNTFNSKLSTIDTTNISNFYLKVRKNLSAGTGIGYSNTSGVISNNGVLSVNGNTGALTMDTGYISNFYLKTRSLFNPGAGITYNAATGLISSTTSTANLWAFGGNTVGAIKTIGTIDNYDFPFITNNAERMRLSNVGNLGIGATSFDATYPEKLLVNAGTTTSVNAIAGKGSINNYLQLNIQNQSTGANASSDVVATADNGSEINNYVDMGINSSANASGAMGGANDAYLYNIGQNLLVGTGSASKSLVFMTGGTSQTTNERMRIDGLGNIGIGNILPAQKLDVTGNFKLTGAFMPAGSAGNAGDFLISAGTGLSPTWTNAASYLNSTAWLQSGNTGTTSVTDFIGTTDYKSFKIKTNNVQGFILDSLGNVGIGDNPGFTSGTNRENLLVDAGTTSSVNAIVGRGNINSYLQLNIQNQSTGTSASSDVVATANNGDETTNYVDMGINGGNYTGGVMGAANDSYLYNVGQNFLIGTGTAAKSLVFMTGGTSQSANERMRIDGTGKVGIGTNAPASDLTLFQANGGANPARGFRFTGNSISGNNSGTGFNLALGYNITNNKQLWLGDADYLGSSSGTFLRYSITNGFPTFDAVAGDGASRRSIALGVGGDPTSAIVLGGDFNSTAPTSYIWGNGNMAIGASYRANAAPTNGLIVQGNTGIGLAAPTAALQLRAGTATASTGAPLKFTSGTNLTTPEDGAVEYDGTNYAVSVSSTRYILAKTLTVAAVIDFPSIIGVSSTTQNITVTGAADGDVVSLGVPNSLVTAAGVVYTVYVSSANTVTVKFTNNNALTPVNPPSATFRISVIKY